MKMKMVGICCRPSFFPSVCSFELHVAGAGVEPVRDTVLLRLELLEILFYHSFDLLSE